jgi:hypothetical protein
MEDRKRTKKSNDGSPLPDAHEFALPVPEQPLREWTADQLNSRDMIAAMETVLASVDLGPTFEADRLASKNCERFVM